MRTKTKPKKRKRRRPRGRPTVRTERLVASLIEWHSNGGTVSDWCDMDGHPSRTTVYRWLEEDKGFSGRFGRARELYDEAVLDQVIKIADTPVLGEIVTEDVDAEGKPIKRVVKADMLGQRKFQVQVRLQRLGRSSNKYGDKVKLEHTGSVTFEDLVIQSMALPNPNSTAAGEDGELGQ